MRHLGWYNSGSERRVPAWFVDGRLDPVRLSESILFRSGVIELIVMSRGESTSGVSITGRGANNESFLMTSAGLTVEFESFPRYDKDDGRWDPSPRWAGFLLACGAPLEVYVGADSNDAIAALRYVEANMSWMAADAEAQRGALHHRNTMEKQHDLNEIAQQWKIKPQE